MRPTSPSPITSACRATPKGGVFAHGGGIAGEGLRVGPDVRHDAVHVSRVDGFHRRQRVVDAAGGEVVDDSQLRSLPHAKAAGRHPSANARKLLFRQGSVKPAPIAFREVASKSSLSVSGSPVDLHVSLALR